MSCHGTSSTRKKLHIELQFLKIGLFRIMQLKSFHWLSENCLLLGTESVPGQISKHILIALLNLCLCIVTTIRSGVDCPKAPCLITHGRYNSISYV